MQRSFDHVQIFFSQLNAKPNTVNEKLQPAIKQIGLELEYAIMAFYK